MEKDEIVKLIEDAIATSEANIEKTITDSIASAMKGIKGGKVDLSSLKDEIDGQVSDAVASAMKTLKMDLGVIAKDAPKAVPKPDYDPKDDYEEYVETVTGEVHTMKPNTIVLMPTKANVHHEAGVKFTAKGPGATQLIRKGLATFVEVYKEPKKVAAK